MKQGNLHEEHHDLVQDIVEEAIEDFALARAIEHGLGSQSVSRDEVLAILNPLDPSRPEA